MSRPRRKIQPKKYVLEESDEETFKEPENKADSITKEVRPNTLHLLWFVLIIQS